MDNTMDLKCPVCGITACSSASGAKANPKFCPMLSEEELLATAGRTYVENEDVNRLALESARTESSGYGRRTRIEEIMDFARRMGYRKLGIAHCTGLIREAKLARDVFMANGFEVAGICCKVGGIEKTSVGLAENEKVRPGGHESLCNPVAQASLLERAGAQFNVVIGLCVGHDSLFFMHSKVPTTVLVAKDRVLGHNPVAALYTQHSYYKRLAEKNGDHPAPADRKPT